MNIKHPLRYYSESGGDEPSSLTGADTYGAVCTESNMAARLS